VYGWGFRSEYDLGPSDHIERWSDVLGSYSNHDEEVYQDHDDHECNNCGSSFIACRCKENRRYEDEFFFDRPSRWDRENG